MNEKETLELIKNSIISIKERKFKPIRVAINGIEGTGKTTRRKPMPITMYMKNRRTIVKSRVLARVKFYA